MGTAIFIWCLFSWFICLVMLGEFLNQSAEINWKTAPLWIILLLPGVIFFGIVSLMVWFLITILENWPENIGPFK